MNLTIKDIVYIAALFVQEDGVSALLESGQPLAVEGGKVVSDTVEAETLNTLNTLVRCANLALGDIATNFVPLYVSEPVSAADGQGVLYSQLGRNLIDIRRVSDSSGRTAKYRMLADRIELPDGEYVVDYNYLPVSVGFDGVTDFATAMVSARAAAYGTACEYSIINGASEEAVLWDKRYRDYFDGIRRRGNYVIKKRLWR